MKQTRAGTTENISVSMPAELVSELRSRTGRRGLTSSAGRPCPRWRT
ncbi:MULTISPECIES: hypothetical protein [unclassified Streptomyces]|nr:hypothetical protein [Streptomyces sp. JV190]MEE1844461.1 hypothetical protein [Streptomyces sp. JV190]